MNIEPQVISEIRAYALGGTPANTAMAITEHHAKQIIAYIDALKILAGAVSFGPSLADLKGGMIVSRSTLLAEGRDPDTDPNVKPLGEVES